MSGTITGSANFAGTLERVEGRAAFAAEGVVWNGTAIGDGELAIDVSGGELDTRLDVIDAAAGTLDASFHLGPGWSPYGLVVHGPGSLQGIASRMQVEASALSLEPLASALGAFRSGGILSLHASAEAPFPSLRPEGALTVEDGSFELPGGIVYDRIAAEVRFDPERIELSRLDARGRRGSLSAIGSIGGPGGRPFEALVESAARSIGFRAAAPPEPVELELRADALPVGGAAGTAARISGSGRLSGVLDPRTGFAGTFDASSVKIELPEQTGADLQVVGRDPDVVIVSGPEASRRARQLAASERNLAFPAELRVRTPTRVTVASADVFLEAEADVTFRRLPDGSIVATGTARTLAGSLRVLGRPFVVEHAIVRWLDGPVDDPHLDVTGRYDAHEAVAWGDVSGTAKDPTIRLRSEPPMTESQVVMLILSGRSQLPGRLTTQFEIPVEPQETQVPGAAASALSTLLTTKVRQALGPRIPLQVLTLETGGTQTQVEAGSYVARNLYLGYVRTFLPEPGENTNELRAQYELSRTIGIQSRIGDAAAGGVDVIWEKQIATPAQQRARKRVSGQPTEATPAEPTPPKAGVPTAPEPGPPESPRIPSNAPAGD
ncbi:hypothetical protein AKJ08_2082 [Vulgatibacter incomptus]|uniref:Translocation and assembly module TamB C-terminal domain-containing protein n=1 Tax=Vulgatibacter incomptus TaxID=1391653 RepID=A0A0K1PDU8_9BACT|nr:hypothetical protein AKJ08_2082 [Vulgatibacter incomptus]